MAVVVFWGVNFAIIKVPLEVAPPFTVNLLRFSISFLVLGAVHVAQSRARGVSPMATFRFGAWRIVGLSLLSNVIYQTGFILGVSRVSAGTSALLIATSPGWTALTGHVLGFERIRAIGWIGIAISLAGVALVVVGDPEASFAGAGLGVGIMLVAAVGWGAYTALTRPLLDRGASPVGLVFWSVALALPVMAAFAVPELPSVTWTALGWPEIGALLFSGGLSTGLAYAIWNESIRRVGAARTAAFSNLVPFVAVLAGVVLQGERVTLPQMSGALIVVAGIVLLRRRGIARA